MKYKYNIGDVVTLKNTRLGKVGIILKIPGSYDSIYNVSYTILVCGYPEPVPFWEDEIEGVIE